MTHGYVVTLHRTPLSLLKEDIEPSYDVRDTITLIHDPRPSTRIHAVYRVEHDAGMLDNRRGRMLTVGVSRAEDRRGPSAQVELTMVTSQIAEMKRIAVYLIQANIPVWFCACRAPPCNIG